MAKIIPSAENSIFALDIGTRTVIGIVALVESGLLRIVAQHLAEHGSRSMFDGQIHDIPKVADTVLEVKRALEKMVGFKLNKAAIAAAGRSLATKQCHVEMEIDDHVEIDGTMVNSLEITGIRSAHQEVDTAIAGSTEKFYCVGYSIVKYYLNNYPVTNLIGHRGKIIGADVLATFLPESVVNGLYAVLGRVGLEPVNLTLEPIAAIEVLIPESMRLLNLALIDIGAGTSDIAITRKGAVVSYGMVPVAGDEITEAVAEALLVDFNWAEKIKRSMEKGGKIVYKDVLGVENTVTAAEVAAVIEPVLDKMAGEIAGSIINLNGGEPPRTVFCVGGGSRLPGLTGKLAEKLGIDAQKVAVRGRAAVQNLTVDEEGLDGPEGVTVVGIATVAIKKLGQNFVTIKVDGKEFRLFNSKDLNVSNALSLLEFNPRDLIGQNGKDLKFTLNGRPEVVYGSLASPAEIYINGEKANLKSTIKDGDEINVLKAGTGADARAYVRDFLDGLEGVSITLNGEPRAIEPVFIINGETASYDCEIMDGDHLEIKTVKTVGELFETADPADQPIKVNGVAATLEQVLKDGDYVTFVKKKLPGSESDDPAVDGSGTGRLSGEAISVTANGKKINLTGKKHYIFVDVLNHIELDPAAHTGPPVLRLNGAAAGFTDALKEGDVIEIYWR
ncbi:rod shape-determining protein [Pelotomaculum terephthalicicum JT]|uniref:cell division protein FtsA n=1 Tax=Pelotomaculum TaxID=191373 RepID=UPI0009C736DD|nr:MULTISPECIES: cell division FtsA domain-containing protein [Pelotomaculum]MCG9966697.1 rod shape-determining protein [Pelotomaculum terephthalicicum JT]OPX91444.1 MAG: Cell division protein FtsA [Pelotomaculum sp. PtaB.Bin117]OPY62980.1 MAG: Cell division protein FtsA [Pelotomaculum sp. PtaU1.Bin065]